jgi:hypothetical protein
MIPIYNGSYFEAMNVKNLLENNGITVFIANEFVSNLAPWTVTSGGLNPVTLKIHDDNYAKAEEIITDYQRTLIKL